MNHAEVQRLLDAYLDDELELATSLAVAAHVDSCEACTQWLAARRKLVNQLKTANLRYREPPGLQQRLQRAHFSRLSAANVAWPVSLAAGLLLGVGGFLFGYLAPHGANVSSQLVAAHVRSALSANAVDVVSSDHHTVKPWLASKLPFSPPVPEFSDNNDTLIGGRVDYIEHTRVAVLIYKHGNHTVDVFIWPHSGSALSASATASSSIDGYRVVTTTAGPFDAAIVSDMNTDEIQKFRLRWSDAAARS